MNAYEQDLTNEQTKTEKFQTEVGLRGVNVCFLIFFGFVFLNIQISKKQ